MTSWDQPIGALGSGELVTDIRTLIEFFDVNTEAQQDASSIKSVIGEEFAIACMVRYFGEKGETARLLMENDTGRRLACTTGKRAGYQLDGWFLVEKEGSQTCYQTEIKSWSFHGIGSRGRRMLIEGAETPEIVEQKRQIFQTYYDPGTGDLKPDGVKKVLLKMQQPYAPRKKPQYPTQNPEPLLCIWEAVCRPEASSSEIFFSVPVSRFSSMKKPNGEVCASGEFDTVNIFSVSNYLRHALAEAPSDRRFTISLPLPRIAERMRLLSTMFSKPDAA